MVSPVDKDGGAVVLLGQGGRGGEGAVSLDGNRTMFTSYNSFAGGHGNPITSFYSSGRGEDGWKTVNVTPRVFSTPNVHPPQEAPVLATSKDLTKVVVSTNSDPITGIKQTRDNLYFYDVETGEFQLLTPDPVSGANNYAVAAGLGADAARIAGYTPDLSHVLYVTRGFLTSDSVGLNAAQQKVYVVDTETGTPTLASITGGTPGTPQSFTDSISQLLGELHHNTNVLSEDATKAVFRTASTGFHQRDLTSGETVSVPNATFGGASSDGRYVLAVTADALVAEDTDALSDVYRLDMEAADLDPELLSPDLEPGDAETAVRDVWAADDDLEHVVFGSNSQLVEGAPTGEGDKMFVWADGEVRHIAGGELPPRSGFAMVSRLDLRMSENGEFIAFQTKFDVVPGQGAAPVCNEIAGSDTRLCEQQIYLYDLEGSEPAEAAVQCISCLPAPEGTPGPAGFTYKNNNGTPFDHRHRTYVTNDGEVLFNSKTALIPDDQNGVEDGYLFDGEGLQLVTGGRSERASGVYGGNTDFSTILIVAPEPLTAWDIDQDYDAYVARRDGGFPEPAPVPSECQGEECRPAPSGTPGGGGESTSTHQGAGNPRPSEVVPNCARQRAKTKRARRALRRADTRRARSKAKRKVRNAQTRLRACRRGER